NRNLTTQEENLKTLRKSLGLTRKEFDLLNSKLDKGGAFAFGELARNFVDPTKASAESMRELAESTGLSADRLKQLRDTFRGKNEFVTDVTNLSDAQLKIQKALESQSSAIPRLENYGTNITDATLATQDWEQETTKAGKALEAN
ncbi:MAG: hypothetical protein ACKO96_46350, partial [Flammeovirgaceae bacterium]